MAVVTPTPAPIGAVVRALAELQFDSAATLAAILKAMGWEVADAVPVSPPAFLAHPKQPTPRAPASPVAPPPVENRRGLPSTLTTFVTAQSEEPAWLKDSEPLPLPDPNHAVPLFEKPIEPLFSPMITRAILTRLAAAPAPIGEVDVGELVETIARRRPLTVLPRRCVLTLAKGLDLLIDDGPGMELFNNDIADLVDDLALAVGRDRLTIRVFRACPNRGVMGPGSASIEAYRPPPAGTPVLAVTDFGVGEQRYRAVPIAEEDWLAFASKLLSRGSPLAALTPYSRTRVPPALRRALVLITWDRCTGVRLTDRRRSDAASGGDDDGVTRLARLASIAGRIDPQLLRSLRLHLAADLGTEAEADLWFSKHVQSAAITGAVLRPVVQRRLQDELTATGGDTLTRVWEILFQLRTDRPWAERDAVSECSWLLAQEELTYWALKSRGKQSAERAAIEGRLKQILKTLVTSAGSDRERDAVSWTRAAKSRLPPSVLALDPMQHLLFGAALRGADTLTRKKMAKKTAQGEVLHYLVPRGSRPLLTLWFRLVEGGFEAALDSLSGAHRIETVALEPLPLAVSWTSASTLRHRAVALNPPRSVFVALDAEQIEISTADSRRFMLSRTREPVSINVPPAPTPFIDREGELKAALDALLAPRPATSSEQPERSLKKTKRAQLPSLRLERIMVAPPLVVAIVGPEGIGKFTLARKLVHEPELRERYRDGIIWLGEDGSGYPRQWLRDYCEAVGVSTPFGDQDIVDKEKFNALFSGRRVLFVADDRSASDMLPMLKDQAGPGCAVLVLSRFVESSSSRPFIVLAPLPADAAQEALAAFDAPADLSADLVAFATGNPLLLRLAAVGANVVEPEFLAKIASAALAKSDPGFGRFRYLTAYSEEQSRASALLGGLWSTTLRTSGQGTPAGSDVGGLSEGQRSALWRAVDARGYASRFALNDFESAANDLDDLVHLGLLETLGAEVRLHPLLRTAIDALPRATMQGATRQPKWIRKPQGDASAVFVHGILSSGETCWRNDNGSYWPELLKNEPELAPLGIYVFSYQTGFFSGSYRIGDIVDALKEHMRLDGVLESKRLIFICHSMGGIVVRKLIVERAAELIATGKEIDLFLVASPSLGSSYADWLSPIAQLFGHAQADALRFVRNNDWLKDLDKEFMNLKEGGELKIRGEELIEDRFIESKKTKFWIVWGRQVVEPFAGARYFGKPYKVPVSDHFSIAKPADNNAIQHRLLCQFILENALSPSRPEGAPPHINRGEESPKPPTPASGIPVEISRIIEFAPAELIGRGAETKLLNDAWAKAQNNEAERPYVLTFIALSGEGRTSLVAKWVAELAHQDWPGCDAAFAWSFYSQGTREQVAASSDVFLKEALTFFGDPAMAGSAQGAFDKGRQLAHLVGERRALLILDGLEVLQYAPSSPVPGELKDAGVVALLKGLATTNKGLCVVTTRYSIADLRAYRQTTAPEWNLSRLSKEAGVALLRSLGVNGTQQEFETLVEDVNGHALTLNLLGAYLRDAHAGDIRKRALLRLEEADEEHGGPAFRVMVAYVAWFQKQGKRDQRALALLRLLGLFDRPADASCLKALWKAPAIPDLTEPLAGISEAHRNLAITRLEDAKLLTVNRDKAGALLTLDAHPLLREYFAKVLREQRPEAWRAAHRRLYEHLCATTNEGPQPTLEDLQPLYQAVPHGCQAGMAQEALEVYRGRILRGQEYYSANKLGAFHSNLGAVACFFDQPWRRVSPALRKADQAWLLNEAAFAMRALGGLAEALEPVRAALDMRVKEEDWNNAAISAGNLSQLELTLGEAALAAMVAEQAVTYAERSGDAFQRAANRTTHADALHQAGRRNEAETLFREAAAMQAENQPEDPLLYSPWGFRYCDLLLAAAECAAWRRMLNLPGIPLSSSLPESCRAVSERAARTHHWAVKGNVSLLTVALDHLTLGRAALYAAILQGWTLDRLDPCREFLHNAVNGLRHAGMQDVVPLGHLTRAWLRFLTGARTGVASAQNDLDETWEIAERGPMPLFMADIHLHRARLFGLSKDRPAKYPWTSPQADLTEARRLIEQHGYWRRKEELEDAEDAARQ